MRVDSRVHRWAGGLLFHHVDSFTVRTNPGRAIGDAPFILGKTFRADFKTATATPAEWFFLFAAVAMIFLIPAPPSA